MFRIREFTLRPALAAAIALLALPAAASAAGGNSCLKPHSWVAGTTGLCHGTVVYGDYVNDDWGADTGDHAHEVLGFLSPSAGDQAYPPGQEATADLIRLTLSESHGKLRVKGLLSALYDPRSTVLAVAIDTDTDRDTGGGQWGDLGVSSRGWEEIAFFDHGNTATNVIRGSMPLPDAEQWRVQAVTAIAADGQVMNVAFRGPNERSRFGENAANAGPDSAAGAWFEDEQARALAAGDITRFSKKVTTVHMTDRRTRPAPEVRSGFHERVYRSPYTLPPGEGIDYDGIPGRGDGGGDVGPLGFEQAFNFPGHYQPYGIYLPEKPGPHGIQMVFHGSSANLASLIGQPGMQQTFGEDLNRILVTPEGRGTEGWGSDISESDLLSVIDDVTGTYDVNRRKIFAGGYSQGGYVTYRMAGLHPDMFAGVVDWVGFTGDEANGSPSSFHYTGGAVGNGLDFVPNLLNVPSAMLYAAGDELVHFWTADAMNATFAGTDNIYRFYDHPTASHLTFAAADDWAKEAAYSKGRKLDRNPPRVLFQTARFLDAPQYGIVHDSAYWISKLRVRGDDETYGRVDLTSAGCGGKLPVLETTAGSGSDPVPWTSDDQSAASYDKLEAEPRLTGELTKVSSVTIDADRTCLAGKRIRYRIKSDGPATIRFSDGRVLKLDGGDPASGTLP